MGDSDCVLTGYYTPVSNPVSYSYSGNVPIGAPALPVTSSHSYNTAVALADGPLLAGYDFSGWNTSDTTVSDGSLTMPAKGVVFTGSWSSRTDTPYQVEYYQQDISDDDYTLFRTDRLTGTTESEIPLPDTSFVGFTFKPDAPGSVTSATINGDGSSVLKLYYDRNSYNVRFQITGEPFADEYYLQEGCRYGTPISLPAATEYTGYSFSGWTAVGDGLDSTDADGYTVPAHDVTMTGSYTIHSFPVTYSYTGDVPGESALPITVTYNYGQVVPLAPDAAAMGYDFSGWSCEDTEITDGSFTMPDHAVQLTGSWTARSNTYRVEYYWETPDGMAYQLHDAEDLTALTAADVQAEAKEYTGFTLNTTVPDSITEGTVAADGSTVLRLYYDRKVYKVSYQITGFSYPDDQYLQRTYLYGAPVMVEDKPEERAGYTFNGWHVVAPGFDGSETDGYTMPAHDVTLTGQWYSDEDDSIYHVMLSIDGSVYTVSAKKNEEFTLVDTPVKKGYVFKGWSTKSGGTIAYRTGDTVTITSNLTLYADFSQTGYIQGFSDGTFKPDKPLTKTEASLMFSRLGVSVGSLSGSDSISKEAFNELLSQLGAGLSAREQTAYLTRAEAVVALSQALGYSKDEATAAIKKFPDVPEDYWAYQVITTAAK